MASGEFLPVDNYDVIIFRGIPARPHLKLLEVKKGYLFLCLPNF